MTAPDLLASLAASGVSVCADGGALRLRPARGVPDELRDRIIELKPELLLLLQSGAASGASTPTAPPAEERAACRDRIRTLAASVSPGELLRQRKRISPALRRVCSAEEIHELILVQCLLARGIEPHGLLKRGEAA
jgi:hypothetical protein